MESGTYYFAQSPNLFKNEYNNNNNNRLSTEEKKIPKNEYSKFHEYSQNFDKKFKMKKNENFFYSLSKAELESYDQKYNTTNTNIYNLNKDQYPKYLAEVKPLNNIFSSSNNPIIINRNNESGNYNDINKKDNNKMIITPYKFDPPSLQNLNNKENIIPSKNNKNKDKDLYYIEANIYGNNTKNNSINTGPFIIPIITKTPLNTNQISKVKIESDKSQNKKIIPELKYINPNNNNFQQYSSTKKGTINIDPSEKNFNSLKNNMPLDIKKPLWNEKNNNIEQKIPSDNKKSKEGQISDILIQKLDKKANVKKKVLSKENIQKPILQKISSKYILLKIFDYIEDYNKFKMKLFSYSHHFQNKLDFSLFDYQKKYFDKIGKKIEEYLSDYTDIFEKYPSNFSKDNLRKRLIEDGDTFNINSIINYVVNYCMNYYKKMKII